jgi:hypothetical protein
MNRILSRDGAVSTKSSTIPDFPGSMLVRSNKPHQKMTMQQDTRHKIYNQGREKLPCTIFGLDLPPKFLQG